jgi:hypothetical protein
MDGLCTDYSELLAKKSSTETFLSMCRCVKFSLIDIYLLLLCFKLLAAKTVLGIPVFGFAAIPFYSYRAATKPRSSPKSELTIHSKPNLLPSKDTI